MHVRTYVQYTCNLTGLNNTKKLHKYVYTCTAVHVRCTRARKTCTECVLPEVLPYEYDDKRRSTELALKKFWQRLWTAALYPFTLGIPLSVFDNPVQWLSRPKMLKGERMLLALS
jgi:hypothetical protein